MSSDSENKPLSLEKKYKIVSMIDYLSDSSYLLKVNNNNPLGDIYILVLSDKELSDERVLTNKNKDIFFYTKDHDSFLDMENHKVNKSNRSTKDIYILNIFYKGSDMITATVNFYINNNNIDVIVINDTDVKDIKEVLSYNFPENNITYFYKLESPNNDKDLYFNMDDPESFLSNESYIYEQKNIKNTCKEIRELYIYYKGFTEIKAIVKFYIMDRKNNIVWYNKNIDVIVINDTNIKDIKDMLSYNFSENNMRYFYRIYPPYSYIKEFYIIDSQKNYNIFKDPPRIPGDCFTKFKLLETTYIRNSFIVKNTDDYSIELLNEEYNNWRRTFLNNKEYSHKTIMGILNKNEVYDYTIIYNIFNYIKENNHIYFLKYFCDILKKYKRLYSIFYMHQYDYLYIDDATKNELSSIK